MATVLVVDDDALIVELIQQTLEDAGYHVVTAHDGEQALELVEEAQPDAVVTDLMMPRVDGATLCWQLKANTATQAIRVMLISASSRVERHLRTCRVDAFLPKPFDLDEIVNMVRQHVGGDAAHA